MRLMSTVVLPLPAPASSSSGPCVVMTARRCISFRPEKRRAMTARRAVKNLASSSGFIAPPLPPPAWRRIFDGSILVYFSRFVYKYVRRFVSAFFSMRLTCTCDTPSSPAIFCCVRPWKYRRSMTIRSRSVRCERAFRSERDSRMRSSISRLCRAHPQGRSPHRRSHAGWTPPCPVAVSAIAISSGVRSSSAASSETAGSRPSVPVRRVRA